MSTITSLLQEIDGGDADARQRLYALVYPDLKNVARNHLHNRHPGLLQTTALVNAAFERLAARASMSAADRRQFFCFLSRAMHDVVVEQARSELSQKRGGGAKRVPLVELATDQSVQQIEFMDLDAALRELTVADPSAHQVILLRFYAGQTLEEVAETIGETFAATRRHWEYGKAWLHERLANRPTDPGDAARA